MTEQKITHAGIVPLIGGGVLGAMAALDGQLPEYILTYSPFNGNDSHCIEYLRSKRNWKGDYVVLDDPAFENYKPNPVDVVTALCPCAGLSSFSTTSSADSATNDWLYKTADYVLSNVGPKVFWGENAPRLYSNNGKKVADKLYEIGRKNGYSLNLYYTESRIHGLCQKRPRTFYFFTKGDSAPIFKYWKRDSVPFEDTVKDPVDGDLMNVRLNKADPIENAWVSYVVNRTGASDVKDLYNKFDKSENLIVISDKVLGQSLTEVADWMDENGFNHVGARARRMQEKLDQNKGYWGHGVTLAKGIIPSLIGAMPGCMINPKTGLFLTLRDCLNLMGMPEDFNLAHEKPESVTNHICQSVPVGTARDMMDGIIEYLDGKCETSGSSYIKQTNKKQIWESVVNESSTAELSDFLSLKK